MITKRTYQQKAHKAIKDNLASGVNRQLIQMATGTGKTVVFSQLPEELQDTHPGQMLILAHRDELLEQAIAKMRLVNPTLRIDKEMANHKADPSLADCVVASVASLGRKGTSRINKYNWDNFDKFVTDEAHHSTAQSYQNIYEASGILDSKTKLLIGFTATPQRSDGEGLSKLYQKIVYSYGMREAIDDGFLAEPMGIKINTDISLDQIKTLGGDYELSELEATVNTPIRNAQIVKAWLDHGQNRSTIGFCVDIRHAQNLAEVFKFAGVKAEAIWGADPNRAEKLQRHRDGEIKVLLNCGILIEGYDDWQIGCIIMGRPSKSNVLFTQMIGRGTRLGDGKLDCIILDIVDSSSRHSLITLPTLMGMPSGLDLQGKGLSWSAKQLEEAQKEFPSIDFSQLPDLSQIKTFAEKVSLFDIKFPPEVEANSQLTWYTAATGGYVLLMPNKDKITIHQNLLDKWEMNAIIKGQKYKGERDKIEDAFAAADKLILEKAPEILKVVKREATWHNQPATPAQLNLIAKLYKGKTLPPDLDKGKASRLISAKLAGKA